MTIKSLRAQTLLRATQTSQPMNTAMHEIEGWLTLIGSSHTMIHTKQARPGKKTEFFYKLFMSSRTVKHSNLNSALGKRMLLRILKKETSGREIFCLQAPMIILVHMSRTKLIRLIYLRKFALQDDCTLRNSRKLYICTFDCSIGWF